MKEEKMEKLKIQIIGNLKTAITMLEEDGFDRIDSVAWRVADAGLMVRELAKMSDLKDSQGIDIPTGMGAIIPERQS